MHLKIQVQIDRSKYIRLTNQLLSFSDNYISDNIFLKFHIVSSNITFRTQCFIFLLLFSLLPQPAFAVLRCAHESDQFACYDPDLNFQVGDQFSWFVIEASQNDQPERDIIDSEEPVKINIEIIKDIRGASLAKVVDDWDLYFKTNFTVAGQPVDTTKSVLSTFKHGRFQLITPTLLVNKTDGWTMNRFEYLIQQQPDSPTTEIYEATNYVLNYTRYHSLNKVIYSSNSTWVDTRKNDSALGSMRMTDSKTNIQNGIVERFQHVYRNSPTYYAPDVNYSLTVEYIPSPSEKLKLFRTDIIIPLMVGAMGVIIIAGTILFMRSRKIDR